MATITYPTSTDSFVSATTVDTEGSRIPFVLVLIFQIFSLLDFLNTHFFRRLPKMDLFYVKVTLNSIPSTFLGHRSIP